MQPSGPLSSPFLVSLPPALSLPFLSFFYRSKCPVLGQRIQGGRQWCPELGFFRNPGIRFQESLLHVCPVLPGFLADLLPNPAQLPGERHHTVLVFPNSIPLRSQWNQKRLFSYTEAIIVSYHFLCKAPPTDPKRHVQSHRRFHCPRQVQVTQHECACLYYTTH